MNELQRLEAALRNAHAAGDEPAARRFAQAIRELQGSAVPTPDYERAVANDGWRDVPPPVKPASPVQGGTFGGMGGFAGTGNGAGREFGGPREAGREFAGERGPFGAAIQGAGSTLFGVGVPVAAVDEFVRSRAAGKPRSWNESMEFARGLREGSAKEYPYEYGAGNVLGLAGGVKAGEAVLAKAPAIVKSVFSLQKDQTAKNLLRLAATGAATAGATAGLQEGSGAVAPAAAVGAVLAPVAGAATEGVVGAARWVGSKINPSNAAIRIIAKRLGESADAIATRYNEFWQTMGRRPRLIEIMQRSAAEEMGQISASKVGVDAGRVFREAEQEASDAAPRELQGLVEQGGRTLTVPEQAAELPPIEAAARRVVNSRVRSTETAQLARRDAAMDAVMGRIGDVPVHATEAMKDILEHPDVQQAMPPILRRRVNDAIANGLDVGSIDIPLHIWEKMRFEMGKKAGGPGASQFYSDYRRRIADYVSGRVPEYGRALLEYGRRSVGAEATTAAERAVTGSAREFADMLRVAGGEPHGVTARATTRVGVRNWLSKQMHERPRRVLERLGRDSSLRDNVRAALSQDEIVQLEALGEQYGRRLNIIEGIKAGQKVLTSDAETFADAVATARAVPGGAAGVTGGARGKIAAKIGESPASAAGTAAALAENPGFQDRIATALNAPEAARLQRIGETSTRAARNMDAATPGGTDAQRRMQAQAQAIQEAIGGVMVAGKSSGAFKANILNSVTQRLRMSHGTATRVAEMAVNPNNAAEFIRRVRLAGVREDEVLRWYQAAAAAAGITTGASLSDTNHR